MRYFDAFSFTFTEKLSFVFFFKFYFLFDIPFFPYFPFDNIRPHQPSKQWAVKDLNDFLLLCSCLYMFWPSSAALTGKRGPCGSTLS